jgi:hypothetical protein
MMREFEDLPVSWGREVADLLDGLFAMASIPDAKDSDDFRCHRSPVGHLICVI